jgi:dTDP-4-amino-4,6-dideoxygalactose transaminase
MRHLEDWSGKRREHAAQYDALLAGVEEITIPTIRPYNVSIFHQYVIRAPRRNELQGFLQDRGVGSGVYYPLCLHQQECFAELGYAKGAFPNAEAAADEVLALPVYPELSEEQIAYVAEQVKAFYA